MMTGWIGLVLSGQLPTPTPTPDVITASDSATVQALSLVFQVIAVPLLGGILKALYKINGTLSSVTTKQDASEKAEASCRAVREKEEEECKADRKGIWGRLDKHTEEIGDVRGRVTTIEARLEA